jgi:hypothetical protein
MPCLSHPRRLTFSNKVVVLLPLVGDFRSWKQPRIDWSLLLAFQKVNHFPEVNCCCVASFPADGGSIHLQLVPESI